MVQVKGTTERRVANGRPKTSQATADIIVKLYNEDYRIDDICEACKVSRSTVYRIIRERRNAQNGKTE
jgi:AraC-like DNA-binding protein